MSECLTTLDSQLIIALTRVPRSLVSPNSFPRALGYGENPGDQGWTNVLKIEVMEELKLKRTGLVTKEPVFSTGSYLCFV